MAKKNEIGINEENKKVVEKDREAPIQFLEREIANKKHDTFDWLSHQDLLAFREFTDMLYAFYDNEMKVYGGEFGVNDSSRYKTASTLATKYLKIKELIFKEIKRRTDEIYEKTLVQD